MIDFTSSAIVTVRSSSSRLKDKPLKLIYDDYCAIDVVIARAKLTKLPVILATSTDPSDDVFIPFCEKHNITLFRGALLNKLHRWKTCFDQFNIKQAILVDGDDLLFDFDMGQRAIQQLESSTIDLVQNPPESVCGFFTYALSHTGIQKLYEQAKEADTDTDVITVFIERANLITQFLAIKPWENNTNIRLTLDYEEDLDMFQTLIPAVGIDASGETITHYLSKHPDVININFKRHLDFLKNQENFNNKTRLT